MSCYCQTGKHGDLLSLLPILYHEFVTTGIKPTLVVSKAFRQIPESLDYINTVIFDGDMQDLEGAIKFAKSQFSDVKIAQLHGKGFTFEHRHPSFQYDQWDRAGALSKWDTLPLVLPRRPITSKPIVDLLTESPSYILFGDHSQSSPFFHKEELAKALQENFPQHQIVRLSEHRASHPLDLLALMDAADLIICADSMPLHLSAACKTPVIALVTDNVSRWHGSGWSKRFALHCRYSDYNRRSAEIIRVAKRVIQGKPALVETPLDTMARGYNPSIIKYGDKTLTVHRHHPKRHWKTRLAINDGTISDIIFPKELEECSFEDARLFTHQGKLMLTYVLAKSVPVSNTFRCVVGYGMLVQREGRWHLEKHIQPVFRNNDWSGMVKNWMPFEHDGKIHFIYGNHFGEQIVIQVDGEKVTQEFKSPEAKWGYGEIRGGAIVPRGDKFLRFFHSRQGGDHWGRHGTFQYHVGAILMEAKPPFKVIQVGQHPILSGDERYVPGVYHWKPNCCLIFGAIAQGEDFLISFGRNDSSSHVAKLRYEDLALT